MPESFENKEPFDPLYSLREQIISNQDEADNSENLLKHANLFTTDVTETLTLAKEKGITQEELQFKLHTPETVDLIKSKLDEAFSSEEYIDTGFSGKMASDAKTISFKITNIYMELRGSVLENTSEMDQWDFATPEALKLASDYKNGELKDQYSRLTPKKYHYSTSFAKAIDAVNEALNLPTDVVITLI